MLRMIVLAGLLVGAAPFCQAQDNPVLQKLVENEIRRELLKHDSQDSGFASEAEDEHTIKGPRNPFNGERPVLLRWSDRSSSNVWLVDPEENLSVSVTDFRVEDDTVFFAVSAKAKAEFRVHYEIEKAKALKLFPDVEGTLGGTARIRISIDGQTSIRRGKFAKTSIEELRGKINDIRFDGELAKPAESLVESAMNEYLNQKEDQYKRDLENVVDGTRIP